MRRLSAGSQVSSRSPWEQEAKGVRILDVEADTQTPTEQVMTQETLTPGSPEAALLTAVDRKSRRNSRKALMVPTSPHDTESEHRGSVRPWLPVTCHRSLTVNPYTPAQAPSSSSFSVS